MKNTYKNIITKGVTLFAFLLIAVSLQAQTLKAGYFLKGNPYRHRINPALVNDQNFVAVPVLGGIGIGSKGNVGLGNFVYKSPTNTNELVTFMHPSVSADEFLGDLDTDNTISANIEATLASAGFFAFGGYNTIDLSLRSSSGINAPYDLFRFMKAMENSTYDISDLRIKTTNFIDFSLGHSRKINKELTVGARVKFLFGVAYADVEFDRINVTASGTRWSVAANGVANIAMGGQFKMAKEPTKSGKQVIDGYEDISAGLNGFGMGIDLGATYDLSERVTKGLTVSASLTDLGFINWSKTAKAAVSPDEVYEFDGFDKPIGIHGDNRPIEDQFDDLKDELEDFFGLQNQGEGSESCGIGAKLNLGVEYKMPFYDKLSAGLLYTHAFQDVFSYNEVTLAINYDPCKWFNMAVSSTVSDFGTTFGAIANLHLTGLNIFTGFDLSTSDVGAQGIPLEDMNTNVVFGITVPFGKKR